VLSKDDIIKKLKKELPTFAARYGVKGLALYGSYARGKQNKKSDIDILVDLKKPLGLSFIELSDKLEEILGHKVDLATFDCFKRSFHNPRYKHIAEEIKNDLIHV